MRFVGRRQKPKERKYDDILENYFYHSFNLHFISYVFVLNDYGGGGVGGNDDDGGRKKSPIEITNENIINNK